MTAELVSALVVVCSLFCLIAGAAAAVHYMKVRMQRAQAVQRLRAEVRAGAVSAFAKCMQGCKVPPSSMHVCRVWSTPSQLTSLCL